MISPSELDQMVWDLVFVKEGLSRSEVEFVESLCELSKQQFALLSSKQEEVLRKLHEKHC